MPLDLDGLIPATVLPMHADGSIDEPALRSYIGWVAAQGPVALAINVDTGEGPHLTHDEKVRIIKVVREVTDLPIVAGLAGPSTDAAVRQARDFQGAGADALLVFPIPAYLSSPLNSAVPVAYHTAIAEVGLPLILFQLQPALAGVNFENDVLRAMAEVDGVVAIKEASFDSPVRRHSPAARAAAEEDHPSHRQLQLHPRVVPARRDSALIGFGVVMTREQVYVSGRGRKAGWTTRWPSVGACSALLTSCLRLRSATTACVSRSASGSWASSRPRTSAAGCSRSQMQSVPTSRTSSWRSTCCVSRLAPAASTDGDRTC